MRNPKLLFFSYLFALLAGTEIYAQKSVPDCDDIKVEVKTNSPVGGTANGSIELIFDKELDNYKIFWVNSGAGKTDKTEVKGGKIEGLKTGFFDILILDKSKKGCIRELTVILK